jgi:hypothetical protein
VSEPKKTKVRVIVLDGLDWEWLHAHPAILVPLWDRIGWMPGSAEHGVLPSPPEEAEGCCARLRSCAEPITPSAVAALLSGRDAGMGWFSSDRFATSQELIRTRPWFPELARYDMTIGLCNIPLTWPAFPLPAGSWMVSGFPVAPAARQDPMRPWSWAARGVDLPLSRYPIDAVIADTEAGPGGTRDYPMFCRAETEIARWFVRDAPRADVEMLWLRSTDAAGHHAWGTPTYEAVVRHAIATALLVDRLAPADATLLISDHGFSATEDPRCAEYHATSHGETARKCGLPGSHTMDGILFAWGERIRARGWLPDQHLPEVAGGIFDLLGIPPAPGMLSGSPAWASPLSPREIADRAAQLAAAGYAV